MSAAPKCRAELSDKVLAHKLDRFPTSPSDWNGWFGFGADSGIGWVTELYTPGSMVERDESCMDSEARAGWHASGRSLVPFVPRAGAAGGEPAVYSGWGE